MYQERRWVLTFYLAGLAVETLFRAYIYRLNQNVEKGHNLRALAEQGRFFDYVPESQKLEIDAALGDVVSRWNNLHRYLSEDGLRAKLNEAGLYKLQGGKTIKGDVVAYNGGPIIDAATTIVTLGVARWRFFKP